MVDGTASAAIPLRDPDRPSGPPLPEMSPAAELALLARCLHHEGYDDHISGHASWKLDDGRCLVDPRGVTWDRVTEADIVETDGSNHIVTGRWGISPALAMHWEIHRRNPDARVIVHHHSRYGAIWAAVGRLPPVYDQTSALLEGGLVLYPQFDGSVALPDAAQRAAEAIGTSGCAILAHHGVVVTGRDPAHAFQRAVNLEWRCRIAWHVEAMAGGPAGAPQPLADDLVAEMASIYAGRSHPELFAAMAHRLEGPR